MRWLRLRLKGPPCFGFVRTLAHIISVGQYITSRSPSAIFVANEEVSAFDVFGSFEAQEEAIDFKPHGRLVVLEENVLFDVVSLGLDKVSCMED